MQLPEQTEQDFEVEMRQKSRPVTEVPSVLPELGKEKQTVCTIIIFEFSARKMGTKTWCVYIFAQCMPFFPKVNTLALIYQSCIDTCENLHAGVVV